MKKNRIFIATALIAACTTGFTQTSVQCTVGADGRLAAALVWQNTLGIERANALCNSAHRPPIQSMQPSSPNGFNQFPAMQQGNMTSSYQPLYANTQSIPGIREHQQYAQEEEFIPMR